MRSIQLDFCFIDEQFDGEHSYEWSWDLSFVPRVGDEISLPGLEGGGPLWHGEFEWEAHTAVVTSVIWRLPEEEDAELTVDVLCRIQWWKHSEL